ncbi:hypothetical protein EST38_g13317 [Candolleomyces aberdarensis]|uniref:Uncharacterized protein n=1 Tax=Candolleomyces aberdarensis TaxID=2316362 RepID=A0A4Q2D2I4_9AGAR|nr:hypothetical protein EST38_g13317 [Candolleomyces aberdarensis]
MIEHVSSTNENIRKGIAASLGLTTEVLMKHRHAQISAINLLRAVYELPVSHWFSECIRQAIPSLVDIAVKSGSNDVRQLALCMTHDLCGKVEFQGDIKDAIMKDLNNQLESQYPPTGRHHDVLSQLLKCAESVKKGMEQRQMPFSLPCPWGSPVDFLRDVVRTLLDKIITLSIYGEEMEIDTAQMLLRQIVEDERLNPNLEIDVSRWLNDATTPRFLWTSVPENFINVSGIFKNHLTVDMPFLSKLVEMAANGGSDGVRVASIDLVSTVCRDRDLSSESAQQIASIIRSERQSIIAKWSKPSRCASWIPLIGDMAKRVWFAEAVPIMLEIWKEASVNEDESCRDAEQWLISALISEELSSNPSYQESLANTLPNDLEILVSGAQSQNKVKEIVARVLKIVAQNIKDGIGDTADIDDQSNLPVSRPLRQFLDQPAHWEYRAVWVDILATLTRYFPIELPSVPVIIARMALRDPDSEVQNVCFNALQLLMDQTAESLNAIRSTVLSNSDAFFDSQDYRARHFIAVFLACLGQSKESLQYANEMHLWSIPELVEENLKSAFQDDKKEVRLSWIEFLATIKIHEAKPSVTRKLLDVAIKDPTVMDEAIGALQRLLKDGALLTA